MNELEYDGGCFCGKVRYSITGAVRDVCYCHCESCRRASGAPFVAWATFAAADFVAVRGELAQHRSSEYVLRGFCSTCAATLTYWHEARADEIDVALVSLDAAPALAPRYHLWVADKLPWIDLNDSLPHYDTVRERREEVLAET
jgi:hypothetical protein